ncbi:acyl carrier protein [Bradyrhizobium diazoefficiens]|jgi:acyl carrier protein|nr:acyl carrier protein [Bradyrhizobium diazoefficiens]MBR0967271.1 acyl carrier protein [Bradyrhizobium diazoefficiens]MBR0977313.1 acyl carrier protein [Bradyrhizobium diazoefficiens]MBR1007972.1 acyl carrier protein [Bradyrhizobium diazoefficiens]MBR1013378.1 acyl carrier protein [Bradyrhizobium diazoefficiens]MBR1051635.1 acyl carrier protein [Bradyrhizobium diazoefficiens]
MSDRDNLTMARAILADSLNVDPQAITEDATIETLESWDSLGHMRLVLAIEAQLTRQLTPMEIAELESLRSLQKILASGGPA